MTFDEFWAKWPNKIAKKDALKAWDRAIARGADPKEIIEGRDRYVENKPDWKAWMHATTFLNGDRWEDVYETPDRKLDPWERDKYMEEFRARKNGTNVVPLTSAKE